MLDIVVLGHGIIPRGHGLAPKKDPFPADLNLINLIISTPGLRAKAVNPTTGKLVPLNADNVLKLWNAYGSENAKKPVAAKPTPVTRPAVPQEREYTRPVDTSKNVSTPTPAHVEERKPDNNNQKKDEKKPDNPGNKNNENKGAAPLKPVNNPDA